MPGKIDEELYRQIYRNFTVIPSDGCETVIRNTRAFNTMKANHHIECRGLIDRDSRTVKELTGLVSSNIYATPTSEAESLLLETSVLITIATKMNFDSASISMKIASIQRKVIEKLTFDKEMTVSGLAATRIERSFSGFDAKAKGKANLKATFSNMTSKVDCDAIYDEVAAEIDTIIDNSDYSGALRIYPNKGLCGIAAREFDLDNRDSYIGFCLRLLKSRDDGGLRDVLVELVPNISV